MRTLSLPRRGRDVVSTRIMPAAMILIYNNKVLLISKRNELLHTLACLDLGS